MNRLQDASEDLITTIENIDEMITEHANVFLAQIYRLLEDALAKIDDYINNQ